MYNPFRKTPPMLETILADITKAKDDFLAKHNASLEAAKVLQTLQGQLAGVEADLIAFKNDVEGVFNEVRAYLG